MSKTKWGRLTWDSNTKNYFHFAGNGGFTGKYYGDGLNAGRSRIEPFSHIIYSDNNSTDKKNRYIANYDTDPTQLLYLIADSMPSNSIHIQNTFSINEDISLFFRYRVGGVNVKSHTVIFFFCDIDINAINNEAIKITNGIGGTTVVTSSYVDYRMNEILIEKLASRNYIHVYFNGKNTYNGTYATTINYKTAPSTCGIALRNSTYNNPNTNGEVGYYEVFACNKILTTASSYTPDWTKRFMEDEFNNKYIIDQGDQLYGKEK